MQKKKMIVIIVSQTPFYSLCHKQATLFGFKLINNTSVNQKNVQYTAVSFDF